MDELFTNTDTEKVEELLHYRLVDGKDALNYQAEQFCLFGETKYKKTIIKMFGYEFDRHRAIQHVGSIINRIPNAKNFINDCNYVEVLTKCNRNDICALLPNVNVISPELFDCCNLEVAIISSSSYSRDMIDKAISISLTYKNTRNLIAVSKVKYFKERLSNISVFITALQYDLYDLVDIIAPMHKKILEHVLTLHALSEDMKELIIKHILEC